MGLRTESFTVQAISEALFPAVRTHPRVLVVDDDVSTAALLSTVSEREGYQVVSVRDGREAYRILKSTADFAAAVFNMTMPHLDGVDILRHMKTEKRLMRIPVVIVAGNHGLKLITESFAAGALAFLPKPLTTEKLALTVRLAIGSRAVRKQSLEVGKMAA
jgi:chemosensory pili system protein ChpA (sensor histidine kinase/response regulator)